MDTSKCEIVCPWQPVAAEELQKQTKQKLISQTSWLPRKLVSMIKSSLAVLPKFVLNKFLNGRFTR